MDNQTFLAGNRRVHLAVIGTRVAVLGFLVALAGFARGDTVYLRSGEKVIGKIITDERTKLVIKSPVLGKVELLRENIERVEFDPTPGDTTNGVSAAAVPVTGAKPGATATNALPPIRNTNTPALLGPRWKPTVTTNGWDTDWIQLKSGEWLRGRLYGMHNRELEFESVELDDLVFDWKDVHQVIAPEALVSFGDRDMAWGSVKVDREKVTVKGVDEVTFPRHELVGIAPGTPREWDYWSGRFNLGMNLRGGNTKQTDLFTKARIERRTANTHLNLEYTGNYSELNSAENVNNHRATAFFDLFLTRRLFLRMPLVEYYSDPFQNIGSRVTLGGGVGYYLIDQPNIEWLVSGGPAYQVVRFDTVQPGEDREQQTPAGALQSQFEMDLTKRIEFQLGYQMIAANQNSGGLTHHATVTLEINLTRRLDLDLSFIWDRISHPETDASGVTPEKDDYSLNLSLGVKF